MESCIAILISAFTILCIATDFHISNYKYEFPPQTYTGDTIVHSSSCAKAAQRAVSRRRSDEDQQAQLKLPELQLESINIPPPVFFCSIEPSSAAQQIGINF